MAQSRASTTRPRPRSTRTRSPSTGKTGSSRSTETWRGAASLTSAHSKRSLTTRVVTTRTRPDGRKPSSFATTSADREAKPRCRAAPADARPRCRARQRHRVRAARFVAPPQDAWMRGAQGSARRKGRSTRTRVALRPSTCASAPSTHHVASMWRRRRRLSALRRRSHCHVFAAKSPSDASSEPSSAALGAWSGASWRRRQICRRLRARA
mmetsp:Transcript_26020/g.88905  ORF Transcript_26020/g.88905 Transcript_26020/m.88905 type:complete len:210 (+) Transcript_26020:340-969(+)